MQRSFTIRLQDVRLHGNHGVFEIEKKVGAEFIVNVSATMCVPQACATDVLADTISYADLYMVVREQFGVHSDLLEHLVMRISDAVMARWPRLTALTVTVSKPSPPILGFTGTATVTLESSQD